MIGEVLGNRYRILRELGSGGMAWVYLAEDTLEGGQVAVKVLYPQYSQDMAYIQRFVREAKLAMELDSPHVVRVLDYGADRDVHYLVMEHLEGKDLAEVIRDRGALPYQEALQIALQVVEALECAHEHGIVHRDIKPQNLMITPDGTVKVLDFGIARARALPSLTQSGFVGSPYYISPEQAMGEPVDIRSDIYSLGVVMYEMLTGELPFDAKSPWSIISQHIANEPRSLRLVRQDLPDDVCTLVNRALAKRPDDRFQSPTELRAAIEAVLAGRPLPKGSIPVKPRSERARELLLCSLYQRAMESIEAEEWARAVNLLTQIHTLEPGYRDVAERLAQAGREARLAALYSAAQQAMAAQRWQEAVDELSEVVMIQPEYRDAQALLEQASMELAVVKTRERLRALYDEGLRHRDAGAWEEALRCWQSVYDADPHFADVARLVEEARREVRKRHSLWGRLNRLFGGEENAVTSPVVDSSTKAQQS